MELTIKLTFDEETMDVRLVDVKTDKIIEKKEVIKDSYSPYARFFDEGSPYWVNNAEHNLMFLRCQQDYCNELLRARGRQERDENGNTVSFKKPLYLNEVYELLGIPKSEIGEVVGWVYNEENPKGDNFVDFNIYNEHNRDFINGYSNSIILDFNVDGRIYPEDLL